MNILIVGGAGFLGTNLARVASRAGYRVTVLDSLEPRLRGSFDNLRGVDVTCVQGDMRDRELLSSHVRDVELIVNCAGQTSHPISMRDPQFDAELNVMGNLALLESVRIDNPEAVVLYTSSSTVVGKAVRTPIDESHPETPLDIYSANKLAAEKYYGIYHRAFGLKTVILRFANLYGPYGKGFPEFGFVNYFIHLAATNANIQIFGEGHQTRNLTYVDDACDAILLAVRSEQLLGRPAFAAHSHHVSVRELAHQIVACFGSGSVTHVEWPSDRRRIEVDDVEISSKFLESVTGWQPQYSLEAGLRATKHTLEQKLATP